MILLLLQLLKRHFLNSLFKSSKWKFSSLLRQSNEMMMMMMTMLMMVMRNFDSKS